MICPDCQHENEATANFCANCGHRLEHACPNCGVPASPSANFCANCGHTLAQPPAIGKIQTELPPDQRQAKASSHTPPHLARKILRDRTAMTGERRTVTVLFIDAVGSTALGKQLDPEDLYALTQAALQYMMDAVHTYEGMVAQFRGDGILALFGAPIAHEDAARRAVGAALEMQRSLGAFAQEVEGRLGVDLRFRAGLNTGRVVVGHIGDDLDMEFTALGDSVNLGARMEAAAEPGTVYVTEATYQATRDYFDFEAVGQVSVKGEAGFVSAYKALGERSSITRFEAAAERGLTPYLGRQRELDLLHHYLDKVKESQGQVILISGEAGIGKSRLLLEFRRSVREEVTWLEGQCISYGKNIPYRPIIDVVKNAFQVKEADPESRIIQRLDEGTAGWDSATQVTAPYLKSLLSVDPGDPAVVEMDPRGRRAGVLDGLRALLLEESRRRPLVIVIEDLHWIDEQSEETLRVLVDLAAAARVLLILTYRAGYEHSLGERSYLDRLVLGDLSPEQSVNLAEQVLRKSSLPKELVTIVTKKGEGNPFFIEEVTRSLVESGVLREDNGNYILAQPLETVRVPDTIQEIILSRIDRLDGEAKAALQLASVIGREFTVRLLERISDIEAELDMVLGQLKTLELIYQEAYFPELCYMFKHALTQDVSYRTLLRERRKTLHRLIGESIEELYGGRLLEQVEMLAHHYYEGEAWEKALTYLIKAGDKSAAAYANHDALDYYARALVVCEKLGHVGLEKSAEVARSRGILNFTAGELSAGIADFEHMLVSARKLEDQRLEGIALAYRGALELMDHKPEDAEESLRVALALAGDEFEDVRFCASVVLAQTLKNFGRHREAKPFFEAAAKMQEATNDSFMISWWRAVGSLWPHWAGRFEEALAFQRLHSGSDDAVSIADLDIRWLRALSLGGKGEYQQSLELLIRIQAVCVRIGDSIVRTRVLNSVGWLYGELQDHRQAMEWNSRGISAAQEANFPNPEVESNARLNLGDNLIALGRLDEAEEQYQHVERIIRNPRPQDHFALWRYSQHHFHSYGELWLKRGEPEKALDYAEECLALAESTESRKNIVKGRRLRGQALMHLGQLDTAEQELTMALEIAQQVGNPTQLWQTYVAQGNLCLILERADSAQQSFQEAAKIVQDVAANLADQALRKTFLSSSAVRAIIENSRPDRQPAS